MARSRTPLHLAAITGAIKRPPARFKGRSDPKTAPIGAAPDWMDDNQRAAWNLFRAEVSWLAEADRGLVEVAACIRGRLIAGEQVGVPSLTLLRQCLGQMGATPADRSKVDVAEEPDDDPAREFFS